MGTALMHEVKKRFTTDGTVVGILCFGHCRCLVVLSAAPFFCQLTRRRPCVFCVKDKYTAFACWREENVKSQGGIILCIEISDSLAALTSFNQPTIALFAVMAKSHHQPPPINIIHHLCNETNNKNGTP